MENLDEPETQTKEETRTGLQDIRTSQNEAFAAQGE
jgi:hypothetical protein